jgi:hypothetical protein
MYLLAVLAGAPVVVSVIIAVELDDVSVVNVQLSVLFVVDKELGVVCDVSSVVNCGVVTLVDDESRFSVVDRGVVTSVDVKSRLCVVDCDVVTSFSIVESSVGSAVTEVMKSFVLFDI